MSKKYIGAIMLPHPRKVFRAIRIIAGMVLLAFGFSGVFYPVMIPVEILSIIPNEIFSVNHGILVLITAFVSMVLGFFLIMKRE